VKRRRAAVRRRKPRARDHEPFVFDPLEMLVRGPFPSDRGAERFIASDK
jgi:hypothetical protein